MEDTIAALAARVAQLELEMEWRKDDIRDRIAANRMFEDRIIDLERATAASLFDLTRRLVDIAGWADNDITAFFQTKADMLRRDPNRSNDEGASPLADLFEHLAQHLALPPE